MAIIKITNIRINKKEEEDPSQIDLRSSSPVLPTSEPNEEVMIEEDDPKRIDLKKIQSSADTRASVTEPIPAGPELEEMPPDLPAVEIPVQPVKKTAKSKVPVLNTTVEPASLPETSEPVLKEDEAFKSHSLPADKEMSKIEQEIHEEVRQEEIDESLSEIYQDEEGQMVDVQKMEIKNKHGLVYWIFTVLITLGIIAGVAYFGNYLYQQKGIDATAVELNIEGPSEVMAGQEYFYTVNYKNLTNVAIKNVKFEMTYPDNFIFVTSEPVAGQNNKIWQIDEIAGHRSGQIRIRGRLISAADSSNIIIARMSYTPSNFSIEYKKEFSYTTTVKDVGINFDFEYITTAMVGQPNEIIVRFSGKENNNIKNFRMSMGQADNIEILPSNYQTASTSSSTLPAATGAISTSTAEISPGVWKVDNVDNTEKEIKIIFKFKSKSTEKQDIVLSFEQDDGTGKSYKFLDKTISYEVVKNSLNLALIVNGTRDAGGADFGQTLNYSIVYSNKGEEDLRDVVIMTVLNGNSYLDWHALTDKNHGRVTDSSISWSKGEIPDLALIPRGKEGTIDFSIKVASSTDLDINKDYQIKSYAQYSLTSSSTPPRSSDDTKSNTVVIKINSDLSLKEKIKYFNDDNIPVGTGPLPPKVGQTTSYRVYWTISNNLHELNDVKVEVKLPANVKWEAKGTTTAGTITYDPATQKVTWLVGRMPITVPNVDGEFSISITPTAEDKDRIMVLLPGSSLSAADSITKSILTKTNKAKTTKLEDDTIAAGDGRVVQ